MESYVIGGVQCGLCGGWIQNGIPHSCPGTVRPHIETATNDQAAAILARLDRIIRILNGIRLGRP